MKSRSQTVSILRTKLLAQRVTSDHVSRPRLLEALSRTLEVPLTLVSAPAGYGKSVLVGEWCDRQEHPCAWVSLDAGDGDLRQFLGYLTAAVDAVHPEAVGSTQALLGAPELPPVPELARELINDLHAIAGRCLIVLDDLHRIERSSPVYELLAALLEHSPRNLHLVLITRQDPPLALVSLRARNDMAEVRLGDLRFTAEETSSLLSVTRGLAVGERALANLQHELEGWPAGLRLVLLALLHADDPDAFLENLAGGLPQTQEYLFQEVLAALPPEVRELLLSASILDRFCPALLDAICQPPAGQSASALTGEEFQALMHRDNLFVVPLEAGGRWCRYHHLFQALLQRELRRQRGPDDIAGLHSLASAWFEREGVIDEALGHALAGGDATLAAEIVERRRWTELDEDRCFVIQRWLGLLPAELLERRPVLLLAQAWVHWYTFRIELLPPLLERVESLVDEGSAEPALLSELDLFRSVGLYWMGEAAASQRCSGRGLSRLPRLRGVLAGELKVYNSIARHADGDGAATVEALSEDLRAVPVVDDAVATRLLAAKAFLQLLSGDLAPTVRAARQVVTVAEPWGSGYALQWGHFLQALAQLHAHRLEEAASCFRRVVEGRNFFERRAAVDALGGLALTHQLAGEPALALGVAEELLAFARDGVDPVQHLALAESIRARLALLQGDVELAARWAGGSDEEAPVIEMFLWLEQPAITRARVQIAQGSEAGGRAALESLGALRPQLEAHHLVCQTIDVAVLQALALEQLGRADEAARAARDAVRLAQPGGWVRPFVEAGPVLGELLTRLDWGDGKGPFVRRVLTLIGRERAAVPHRAAGDEAPGDRAHRRAVAAAAGSGEGLTNRELDVLQLTAQRLRNKEIAERLFISGETVSYHLKHVYQKLAVHGRREAVARAVELGILPPR